MRFNVSGSRLMTWVLVLLAACMPSGAHAQFKGYDYGGDVYPSVTEAVQAYMDYTYRVSDSTTNAQSGAKLSHTATPIAQSKKWFGIKVLFTTKFENDSRTVVLMVDSIIEVISLEKPLVLADDKTGAVQDPAANAAANKSGWNQLPDCGEETTEKMLLATGQTIAYLSIKCSGVPEDKQVQLLTGNIKGLTAPQAGFFITMAREKRTSVVFGGSRLRGNATDSSDLDVGFDSKDQKVVYDIADKYNKRFFGSSRAKGSGAINDKFIFTGKGTDNIPAILSPEEFFMRSGNRYIMDKGGAPYKPSGFISIDGTGNVHLGKPL